MGSNFDWNENYEVKYKKEWTVVPSREDGYYAKKTF